MILRTPDLSGEDDIESEVAVLLIEDLLLGSQYKAMNANTHSQISYLVKQSMSTSHSTSKRAMQSGPAMNNQLT
jgi:hypothetical protein